MISFSSCTHKKGWVITIALVFCVFFAKSQVQPMASFEIKNEGYQSLIVGNWRFHFYEIGVVEVENIDFENTPDTSVSIIAGLRKLPANIYGDSLILAGDWKICFKCRPVEFTFYYKDRPAAYFIGCEKETDGSFSLRFDIEKEKFVTGGGMRAIPLNVMGRRLELRNQPRYGYGFGEENLNYSIPFFITGSGYAIFFDNTSKGWADIGHTRKGLLELKGRGGRIAFWVIPGENIGEITRRFTTLTGRQPLPPLWAFGHLQSRMAYRSQAQVDSITEATLKAGFPLDAMIIDLFWFGNSLFNTMGNLDWYKPNWPHPGKMIKSLREKGVNTVLITEPYIVQGSHNWTEADSLGILGKTIAGKTHVLQHFYFGHGAVIDVTQSQAREWMWKKYDTLLKQGVAGWWIDLAEPEHHPDGIYYAGGKSELIHNAFGHLWDKMLYDNYKKYYPGLRLFNLNRSGFAGSQRYGVLPWTGDVSRSWSGLKAQIPILLNMGMCGVAYVHSDAGGFAQGVLDEELYIRWLQFACFSPILRPHGSGIPSEPIFFSRPTQDIVRRFMKLRYQLLPYNYSLAYENTTTGLPLARPLFATATAPRNDAEQWSYLWGASLLVSPVVNKGERWHTVWLPEGSWYYFFNDRKYKGDRVHHLKNELEELPVFVKAGSFIPMVPPLQNTTQYSTDTLIIHYYPAGKTHETSFTIYVDDGADAGALENKSYEFIHLHASESEANLVVKFESENIGFKARPLKRQIRLVVHGKMKYSFKDNVVSQLLSSPEKNVFDFEWDNHPLSLLLQPSK